MFILNVKEVEILHRLLEQEIDKCDPEYLEEECEGLLERATKHLEEEV